MYRTKVVRELFGTISFCLPALLAGVSEAYAEPFASQVTGHKGSKLGVSVSGGGSRSFSLSRGYFSWLRQNGIEQDIKYLSLVSGAAWFAGAYYGQKSAGDNVSSDKENFDPERLTLRENYGREGDNLFGSTRDGLGDKTKGFSNLLGFTTTFLWQALVGNPTDTLWGDFLAQALAPSLSLPMGSDSFPGKPENMEIIVSALLKTRDQKFYPFEMGAGWFRVRTGRQLPEYILAGEYSRCGGGNTTGSRIRGQDAVAASSANFPHWLPDSLSYSYLPDYCVDECRNRFYNPNTDSKGQEQAHFKLLDNGPVEYLGILPLLARPDIGKIIVFVNSDCPLRSNGQSGDALVVGLEKAVTKLFGIAPDDRAQKSGYLPLEPSAGDSLKEASNNSHVFDRSRYQELVEQLLQKKEEGEAAVYLQRDLQVLANEYHGVPGGNKVDVLWVYNERPENWWRQLSYQVQCCVDCNSLFATDFGCYSTWTKFPFYNSMLDLHLPAEHTNLLRSMAGWVLEQNRELILDWLAEAD